MFLILPILSIASLTFVLLIFRLSYNEIFFFRIILLRRLCCTRLQPVVVKTISVKTILTNFLLNPIGAFLKPFIEWKIPPPMAPIIKAPPESSRIRHGQGSLEYSSMFYWFIWSCKMLGNKNLTSKSLHITNAFLIIAQTY